MQSSQLIQDLIHKMEVGTGSRYLRILLLVLVVVALAFLYDFRAYRNLASPEAMDTAQLAHNLSEGKGYTTLFIRPFSLFLLQRHNQAGGMSGTNADFGRIKSAPLPDLANAPVYPTLLAGLMKVLPFNYNVNLTSSFWSDNGKFYRYQPDFFIALFNQMLLFVVAGLTFFLAKKLFDSSVAWLSAFLVLGSELFWRFSVSGLSTLFLLAIFLGLTLLLVQIERSAQETPPRTGRWFGLALAVGILTGVGALTRYAFGWTIIPVALFLFFFSGPKRLGQMLVALAAFAVVLAPWIIRNEAVSGTAFGTAGYAMMEGTHVFPQFQLERFQLERSIHPELNFGRQFTPYLQKFLDNAREILTGGLLKSGAAWAGMLFFAGLMMGFRSSGARRIRYFLLMCLGLFVVVQSLGRTQLSDVSPEINSENLLVLLVPLVFVFGAGFFFTLLDQMALPLMQLRYAVIAIFAGLSCLPLLIAVGTHTSPVVYPPYLPPEIQQVAGYMKPDELMMSDAPWAVAWYGQRQCVWLTLDWKNDFAAIDKNFKPVHALYLTPQTMDGKFVSEWMEGGVNSWGKFLLQVLNEKRVPDKFPLTKGTTVYFPEQLFLTDRVRWPVAK
jgi:hypothetical protein